MTEWTAQSMQNMLLSLNGTEKALGERISSEIKFAEDFARLKGKEGAWKKHIREACRIIGEAAQSGKPAHLAKAVEEAEAVLAPIGKAAKQYKVHCVGHAHIDMNWMWSWPETVSTTNDTFITVLRLMDEYPDFHFSQSQVSVYEIMREYNPEVFEQIKKRVAEGRWEINAAHWVEGDKNIASGESLARHLLYSRAFMKEHFNLDPEDMTLDWEPDTFGHAHTIPTLDARGGVKRYYFCRSGHVDAPPVFWWIGPDGNRVLAYYDSTGYNGKIGPHVIDPMIQFCEKTGLKDYMWVYGIGDHGGGPTRRDIRMCHEMNSWPIYPTFRLAPARDFYSAAEANGERLPVINSEINFAFMGCYTSQSLIKKTNRLGECMMERADWAATLAWKAIGKDYPSAWIQEGWTNTIFGHFHDILPGSGVPATREYHSAQFQKTAALSSMIQTNSFRALAGRIDFSYAGAGERKELPPNQETDAIGGGPGRGTHFGTLSTAGHADSAVRPFAVFNPTAWDRMDVIPVTVWDAEVGGIHNRSFVIKTPDGKRIPAQQVGKGDYWGHPFMDLMAPVFVKALGYSSFVIEETTGAPTAALESTVKQTGSGWAKWGEFIPSQAGMENEFLAVNIDTATGAIIQLLDKKTGWDMASPSSPTSILEYVLEQPNGMSAWTISPARKTTSLECKGFTRGMQGPLAVSYTANYVINGSTVELTYTLKAGQPALEIAIKSRWVEIGTQETGIPTLRIQFEANMADASPRYEIPYGSIRRTLNHGEEVPSLRWVDVEGVSATSRKDQVGFTLVNDSKYGYSLDGGDSRPVLRATLIRSSYVPDPLPEIADHEMKFALVPHGKGLAVADAMRLGAAFNQPLQIVAATGISKGDLPATSDALVFVKQNNVVMTVLKKSEKDDALILRLLETEGKETTAQGYIDGMLGVIDSVVETDFLERPLENSTAKTAKSGFSVKIPGHGIATVKVTFKK